MNTVEDDDDCPLIRDVRFVLQKKKLKKSKKVL